MKQTINKLCLMLFAFLFLFSVTLQATNNKSNVFLTNGNFIKSAVQNNANDHRTHQKDFSNLKVDCTVTISIKNKKGTMVTGQITFQNVTRWQCVKIKVMNFINNLRN